MLIRAIALSIALLVGIGAIVPLATEYAEAGPRKSKNYKKKHRKYKKYSKRWWRNYYAKKKRNRAIATRKRGLRLHQIRLANARKAGQDGENKQSSNTKSKVVAETAPAVLPSGEAAPKSWKKGQATAGELQFRVDDNNGSQVGSASISVVGPAMGEETARNKTVGGVPQASLRRTVIDRMVRENGWVVNDYQKEINGKKVYVVVAQSQAGAGVQSRMFYFTEVDGRIYSVATNAPNDSAERLAEESEKVINSLQKRAQPVQQAELK
jgi:hypothetical protein